MVSVVFIICSASPVPYFSLFTGRVFCLIRADSLPVFSISSLMLTIFLKWQQLGLERWLRALIAHPEDLSSIPSTHTAAHSHLYLQSQGI